jgi:phosphatidylinositol 4-kinase
MIIHLEVDWDDAILERFALIIAQQSLHFALQLNWILQGAIEDYQPELPSGQRNPQSNPLFYVRCVKLLGNIERCVVYGRPRSMELQRLYEKGNITKREYDILEHADRRFNAFQITGDRDEQADGEFASLGGALLYKRKVRKSALKFKGWKTRYFVIEQVMLNCYNQKGKTLVRSMPLEGATVTSLSSAKYPHMFSVKNRRFEFVMRAQSEQEKQRWVHALEEESRAHVLFGDTAKQQEEEQEDSKHLRLVEDLTPSQRFRFEFFKDERDFVRNMCNVAEELRFVPREERKKLAPGFMQQLVVPSCVYIPMCNSTDIWRRVEKTIPAETRVFNTKERCPTILFFVSRRGEQMKHHRGGMKDVNLDVAEYMHLQYDMRSNSEESMTVIEEEEADTVSWRGSMKQVNVEVQVTEDEEDDVMIVKSEEEEDEGQEKEKDAGDKGDYGQKENKNGDAPRGRAGSGLSAIWHDDLDTDQSQHALNRDGSSSNRTNRQMQSFLKNNFISVPRKLASRIDTRRRVPKTPGAGRASVIEKLPIQDVPIVGADHESDADDRSVVSVERGSVLGSAGTILFGEMNKGDIDHASLERATAIICHGENWAEKTARMLRENEKEDEGEGVAEIQSVMAKSNDDLRQEVFVMQMIHYFKSVFAKANLPLWLKTYRILSTSKDCGTIEVLTDATSIDGLKKSPGFPAEGGLRAYFEQTYGPPESKPFKEAQKNFMQSLAAYSLVSYLLGLKDRHNGNIMIDTRGHLIFIDFGFAMGMAPGHEFSFEKAPFKLTQEYVQVMGGTSSECYKEFERLFVAGLQESRKNAQIALGLVEIMMYKSNYPCFSGWRYGGERAIKRFEKRLFLHTRDDQVKRRALGLIRKSNGNFGTWLYDAFQHWSNGYAM